MALLACAARELLPAVAVHPRAPVVVRVSSRRSSPRYGLCGIPAPTLASCGARVVDAVVMATTALVVQRRQRLLARPPVRLRLLPRPRQRDASRPSAACRHVLPVRRRGVLRADRRVPRRCRSRYGGLQVVLCMPTRASSPSSTRVLRVSGRSQALATLGACGSRSLPNLAGPIEPHIAYPSTGPLRFGLPVAFVILAGLFSSLRPSTRRRSLECLDARSHFGLGSQSGALETFVYCSCSVRCGRRNACFRSSGRAYWGNGRSAIGCPESVLPSLVVADRLWSLTTRRRRADFDGEWPNWYRSTSTSSRCTRPPWVRDSLLVASVVAGLPRLYSSMSHLSDRFCLHFLVGSTIFVPNSAYRPSPARLRSGRAAFS